MSPSETAANGDSASKGSARVGPHPGIISSGNQFSTEAKLRSRLRDNGCDPSRETQYRLQGVQLIDNVREHLHLYVPPLPLANSGSGLLEDDMQC